MFLTVHPYQCHDPSRNLFFFVAYNQLGGTGGLLAGLSHAKLVWADHGTDSIFTADLDGKNIESIVTVTSPFAVTYYTDTGSQSAVPTHSPTKVPVPAPSYSSDPTLDPTAIPSFPPTPFPTYYWSRLYFTAGTTNGGSFLHVHAGRWPWR